MVKTARKTQGTTRKQDAAKRRVTATRNAQAASDGQDQDERLQETINRLRAEADLDRSTGRCLGCQDGEEWAYSASLVNLRRVCEPEGNMDADALLALLSEDWDAQDLASLGEGCDRPNFMLGYADGFQTGAFAVWKYVRHLF
jgi:hypothetical protein